MKILELTSSWCSILRTERRNTLVDHGCFSLQAARHWSHSSLRIPAVHYTVCWPSSSSIWIHSPLIACCFLYLLLPVVCTIHKSASWVIVLEAKIAASWWTIWRQYCCCVSTGGAVFEVPVIRLDSASFAPASSISGGMTCCCGMVRKMIMKRSGKS